ncbi:hypothetical protein HanPI659440_Chr16g0627261 [Helianthus annuus]|nr:hypothetical protein HanPI659440_Chr16g0627261 [Helianthus annuus]
MECILFFYTFPTKLFFSYTIPTECILSSYAILTKLIFYSFFLRISYEIILFSYAFPTNENCRHFRRNIFLYIVVEPSHHFC